MTRLGHSFCVAAMAFTSFACAAHQPPPPVDPVAPAEPLPVEQIIIDNTDTPLGAPIETESIPPAIEAAVSAADRSDEDRAIDAQRHPQQLLAFFGIEPGMSVAELGAGRGYTAELLARVVGDTGKVYAQNNEFILERFAEGPWSERLKKPVMKNVVRLDREFDSPFPPEVSGLDAVLLILFYHDTVWMKTDRDKMNREIFRVLKPGGIYGVVDHSARPGDAWSQVQSLHRVEEDLVKQEIEKAGFELVAESELLKNPEDTRDWNAAPSQAGERRGQSDRFVLKFEKPESAPPAGPAKTTAPNPE